MFAFARRTACDILLILQDGPVFGAPRATQVRKRRPSFRQAEEAIKSANLSSTVAGTGAAYAQRWEAIETLSSAYSSSARAHARHYVHKAKQALIAEIAFFLAPTDDHVLVIGNAYSAGVAGRVVELECRHRA